MLNLSRTESFFQQYIAPNSTIIIGVSGGPDSVFLLFQLLGMAEKMNFKIIMAYVNHGLRGKHSREEEMFVKQLAKEQNLKRQKREFGGACAQLSL